MDNLILILGFVVLKIYDVGMMFCLVVGFGAGFSFWIIDRRH